MKHRAQRLKSKWEEYNQQYQDGKSTYRNFGRFTLMQYMEYHHGKYIELCIGCKERPLSFAKWLLED